MKLSEHIQSAVEMCYGAHYYVQGKQSAAYKKAEATVDLSSVQVDVKNRLVACISLNIIGGGGSCDMGIEHSGQGWFANFWSKKLNQGGSKPVHANATSVKITIEPYRDNATGKDTVKGTFVWTVNNNGTITTLAPETLVCSGAAGSLFNLSGSIPCVRFGRFMSLILKDGLSQTPANDTADHSYLKGGNFSNLKLYWASSGTVGWGMSLLDYIWTVQGWNITSCSIGGTAESFGIEHENYVYGT